MLLRQPRFLLYRKLRRISYQAKSAPRDAHSREEEICRKRPRSARECAKAHSFLIYRKFLKSSEMVYNEQEIKNDITKERREASR